MEALMPNSRRHHQNGDRTQTRTVAVVLSLDDVVTLVRLSSYHGRIMGVVRRLIQVMSHGEMRAKARFVQDESYWLRRFAEATRDRMSAEERAISPVQFTPRTLVAFYGRTLATLAVPRTRRRLSASELQRREALADKLGSALQALNSTDSALVLDELETRRPRERQWIEEKLEGDRAADLRQETAPTE